MSKILHGNEAKEHATDLIKQNRSAPYIHPIEPSVVGGYWKEMATHYIAFDNSSNNCVIEEFATLLGAVRYASGKVATTKGGQRI